jgi:hypothetical protein
MKKNIIINILLLFFLSGTAANAGRPNGEISILNETNKEITVRVAMYKRYLSRNEDDTYEYRWLSAHLNDFDLNVSMWITDINPVVLKPSEDKPFFLYSLHTKGGEYFRNKEVSEQLKAIYQYLSVTDEDGNELLNLDTLKPSNFIQKGTVRWVLVIS